MNYNILSRPKLPRNKYGDVKDNKGSVGGTTYFSSNGSTGESGGEATTIDNFVGSTTTEDGVRGLVPAPESNYYEPLGTLNDNVKFLKGNGSWTDIPISRYTEENNNGDGINLDGNLFVSDALTTQTLNVTGAAHFWELIIDKVKSTSGNLLITPANFVVDYIGNNVVYNVDSTESPFKEYFYDLDESTGLDGLHELFTSAGITSLTAKRLYMKNDDGVHDTVNDFVIGDMVRCKTFNLDDTQTTQNKDYWTMILAAGTEDYNNESCNYIDIFVSYTDGVDTFGLGSTISDSTITGQTPYPITSFTFGYGSLNVEVGDNIVQLGHIWDADRQKAILIAACDPLDAELEAPAIAQYENINKFSTLTPFRTNCLAANGNEFTGRFNVDYNGNYIDLNERLNIFSTDLTTGLETVGIHLDGENSTIRLVGSVEIRQNSDGTTDTLTVYDEDDIVRVQISPDEIPAKSQISTNINPTTTLSFDSKSGSYSPTGTLRILHTWKEFIGTWNHKWKYYLENAYYNWSTYREIGNFSGGDKISISNIYSNITSKAYFKGQTYTDNRGTAGTDQNISSIILYLQRYNTSNSTWVTVTSSNITNSATITVQDESASIRYSGTLLNNYQIITAGKYRFKLDVTYDVYAEITYTSEQSNPYFFFNYTFGGGFTLTQPSAAMTRIGSNGLLYNTSNVGQYFYSGNDGIEAKWGDALLSLDNTYGLKTSGIIQSLSNNSHYISSSATVADARSYSSDTTIYLPNATTYGVGRVITVLGNDFVTIQTINSQDICSAATATMGTSGYPSKMTDTIGERTSISMTDTYTTLSGDGETTYYYRSHNPIMRFMSTGTEWIII